MTLPSNLLLGGVSSNPISQGSRPQGIDFLISFSLTLSLLGLIKSLFVLSVSPFPLRQCLSELRVAPPLDSLCT